MMPNPYSSSYLDDNSLVDYFYKVTVLLQFLATCAQTQRYLPHIHLSDILMLQIFKIKKYHQLVETGT